MEITTATAQAAKTILDVLPALGVTPAEQAQNFALLARHILSRLTPPAAPSAQVEPAPPRPCYPCPADFQPRPVIGYVAGQPVYGLRVWDEDAGCALHFDVSAELLGQVVTTDGETVMIDVDAGGRLPVGALLRIAQAAQAGQLAQLLGLARFWCASAPAAQERAA